MNITGNLRTLIVVVAVYRALSVGYKWFRNFEINEQFTWILGEISEAKENLAIFINTAHECGC